MEARARRSGRRRMLPALTPVHKPGKVRAAPSTADTGPPALGAVERRTTPGYSSAMTEPRPSQQQDFLRAIVAEDLRTGRHTSIVTRFPPEPNGYLHVGHATSVVLNFGVAAETGGRCHLRFDDTNPETEDQKYVDSIIDTVSWLGYDWGEHLYFASDYFEAMYNFAEHLIREGKAYVDSLGEEQIREYRGSVTEPGRPSPYRNRSVDENLDLFRRMRAGEFEDGAHVLRGNIDLASKNMLLRDPVLYRIRHAAHYRTGDDWCVYPLYDYAHPIEDALECITHSFCTLEFENNRALYDWVVDNIPRGEPPFGIPPGSRPRQYEFARRNFEYTIVSKRKLLELVNGGHVSGWDDPRMPTLAGLRRRGYTPEAVRAFCELIGIGKAENRADIGVLEYAIRDDLNQKAPRVQCVVRPLKVVVTNYPEGETEELDAPLFPHDVPREGSRSLPFSRTLYIDRDDFREDPPRGFHRLSPGTEVRLRYAYVIRCDEVVRDDAGEIVELRCTYDPETRGGKARAGRTVKGTIHWVSADHAVPCQLRLYDRLFSVPDPEAGDQDFKTHLNPDSLVVVDGALIEPSVADSPPGTHYQFERVGYFFSDPADSRPGHLVFNRTVSLRDTWAKVAARSEAGVTASDAEAAGRATRKQKTGGGPAAGGAGRPVEPPRSPELRERRGSFRQELGLGDEESEILTRELATADLFEAAARVGSASPAGVANWVIHELPRAVGEQTLENLPFGGPSLAELVGLVEEGALSSSAAREVLAEMVQSGASPGEIMEQRGLRQVSDRDHLRDVVDGVLAEYPEKVEQYRAGRTGLLGFFVGQVMRATGGKANPELTTEIIAQRLS
jgi:glutaminyl-tRNA synthetase